MSDYTFKVRVNGWISYTNTDTNKKDINVEVGMVKALLSLIAGWEPKDGMIVSDSPDNDYSAKVAAAYHGVEFIPYSSSQRMSIDDYIRLGKSRPEKFVELNSRKIWELTEWDDLVESTTGEKYPLTLEQKISMDGFSKDLWETISKLENGESIYQGNIKYEIVDGENGSGVCMYYLNSKGQISNNNHHENDDDYLAIHPCIMALKKKDSNLWVDTKVIGYHSSLNLRSEYYDAVTSVLDVVYNKYDLDTSKIRNQSTRLANTLIYKGVSKDLIDTSMEFGDGVGIRFLDMSIRDGAYVHRYSSFGGMFREGSIPDMVYKGVLLARHAYEADDLEKTNILFDGDFIKVYEHIYSWMLGNEITVFIKLEGKEYIPNNKSLKSTLRKLGKQYLQEYKLYEQLN